MCLKNQAVVRCSDRKPLLTAESTCTFGTIISSGVTLGKRCVVEYSLMEPGVTILDGTIVSNMLVPTETTIPSGCFYHTVCVMVGKSHGLFVTVVFGITDNMKKVMSMDKMSLLKYLGQPVDIALKCLSIKQEVTY